MKKKEFVYKDFLGYIQTKGEKGDGGGFGILGGVLFPTCKVYILCDVCVCVRD